MDRRPPPVIFRLSLPLSLKRALRVVVGHPPRKREVRGIIFSLEKFLHEGVNITNRQPSAPTRTLIPTVVVVNSGFPVNQRTTSCAAFAIQ